VKLKYVIVPVLLAVALIRFPSKTIKVNAESKAEVQSNIWNGYTELKHICSCESWGDPNKEPREYKDGQVLRGFPNPEDAGACQINIPLWGGTAAKLGYDIFTFKGNVEMAKYIEKKQGIEAWKWSKGCWSQK
jgi:hypothetical protein